LYLKTIELIGFKSFANKTIINFENTINGIIGPNGSGKSNISDAIKWVFGEPSTKSLRASDNDDFIFKGNSSVKPLNMAQVKLIFNNEDRKLLFDRDEIEITKRTYRGTGENEYYINKSRVRLKDVRDIVLDAGLSRNSLALISQGNLNDFIVSSPEKKRLFFEEAAGVGKLRHKKTESERKLKRTQENLDRLNDVILTISKQLSYLEKQASKAEKYLNYKKELEAIEVNFIISELNKLTILKQSLYKDLNNNESKKNMLTDKAKILEESISELKKIIYSIDDEIHNNQQKISSILNTMESNISNPSNVINKKTNIDLILEKRKINELRLPELSNSIKELEKELIKLEREHEQEEDNRVQLFRKKITIESDINNFEKQNKKSLNRPKGVQSILEHLTSLNGICGTVDSLFIPDIEYQEIFKIASYSIKNFFISKNTSDAKRAIKFLKENKLGIATFISLDNINWRDIDSDIEEAIKSQEGFINFLSNCIKCDLWLNNAKKSLFKKIILVDKLDNALTISKLFNNKFTIITKDGSLLKPNGSITGGSRTSYKIQDISYIENKKNEVKNISEDFIKCIKRITIIKNKQSSINNQLNNLFVDKKLLIKEISDQDEIISKNTPSLSRSKTNDNFADLSLKKEKLKIKIDSLHEDKKNVSLQIFNKEKLFREITLELNNLIEKISLIKMNYFENNKKINEYISRLVSEYKMTYEYALSKYEVNINNSGSEEEINSLRSKLNNLLPVDISSIEKYRSELEQHNYLFEEHKNLQYAKNELENSIKTFDNIIIEKFTNIIKKTNIVLPQTINSILGAGSAKIVLTEPDNLLNTGVEVNISLPGKKIKNLNLLSGGEKTIVALSVLFSILKINPLPLIFLDEAEAPLDISNVKRFINFLRTFKGIIQFIIITHRPGTMENCDKLYGVTMENKGISKIIIASLDKIKIDKIKE